MTWPFFLTTGISALCALVVLIYRLRTSYLSLPVRSIYFFVTPLRIAGAILAGVILSFVFKLPACLGFYVVLFIRNPFRDNLTLLGQALTKDYRHFGRSLPPVFHPFLKGCEQALTEEARIEVLKPIMGLAPMTALSIFLMTTTPSAEMMDLLRRTVSWISEILASLHEKIMTALLAVYLMPVLQGIILIMLQGMMAPILYVGLGFGFLIIDLIGWLIINYTVRI